MHGKKTWSVQSRMNLNSYQPGIANWYSGIRNRYLSQDNIFQLKNWMVVYFGDWRCFKIFNVVSSIDQWDKCFLDLGIFYHPRLTLRLTLQLVLCMWTWLVDRFRILVANRNIFIKFIWKCWISSILWCRFLEYCQWLLLIW